MKAINKGLEPVLRTAIVKSLENYERTNEGSFLSDIYLHYNGETQTLVVFDDSERELLTVDLNDSQELGNTAKHVLRELEKEKAFDREYVCKPFTVSLVDSDFIVEEELIFIDDHTLKLNTNLWTDMDKELDNFLKDLMKQ